VKCVYVAGRSQRVVHIFIQTKPLIIFHCLRIFSLSFYYVCKLATDRADAEVLLSAVELSGKCKEATKFFNYLLLSWTMWCEEKTVSCTSQQETYLSDDSTFQVIDIVHVYKFTKEDYFFLKEIQFHSAQHNFRYTKLEGGFN
jgi:hypothetical protein